MKRINAVLIIILLVVMAGCGEKQSTDELITVDVTKSYPKKELILQDFLDVEYILLDDINDDFITNSSTIYHVGKEYILTRNTGISGDLFLFGRSGTGLRVINRRGASGEEYQMLAGALLDEENNELIIRDTNNKGLVYDLYGVFKRRFAFEGDYAAGRIFNFNRDNYIWHKDISSREDERVAFRIISRYDGSTTKEIQIPFERKLTRQLVDVSHPSGIANGPVNQVLIPNRNSFVLTEFSSDTIYQLFPDYRMIPFMVRTPSVQSMDPEIFLYPSVLTDRYYFMQTVQKTVYSRNEAGDRTYPRHNLVYDRQEKSLFEYVVYNDDFSTKRQVTMAFETHMFLPFSNNEIAFINKLESYELVEAYKKGELKDGKLKDLVATMNEESNPVIMVAKHRK